MKRLALLALLILPLAAGEPTLDDLLRDALYTEEVTRDPAKAADLYQRILNTVDQQRPLAASALFRLAEIRRNQGDKDAAIALYQQLLRDYSTAEAETKLARQHLAELGGEAPSPATEEDPTTKELLRLQQLAKSSPDEFHASYTLTNAISGGQIACVRFLLENGIDPNTDEALSIAASAGYLEIAKLLFEKGCEPDVKESARALSAAASQKHLEMLEFLLDQGLDPNASWEEEEIIKGLPLAECILKDQLEAARILIKHGADVNQAVTLWPKHAKGTLLHFAIAEGKFDAVRLLLENGADPSAKSPDGGVTPLHLSAALPRDNSPAITRLLLEKGADPNAAIDDSQGTPDKWALGYTRTPLGSALKHRNTEQLDLLLASGAKVSIGQIRYELDRNDAGRDWQESAYLALLEHCPPFDPDSSDASELLETAAKQQFDIKPLVERGAKPSEAWMNKDFEGARDPEDLALLHERFVFPELASKPQVAFFNLRARDQAALASASGDAPPPPLASLLIDHKIDFAFEAESGRLLKTQWLHWRKGENGELHSTPFDLAADAPLPVLKWGDIVELRNTDDYRGNIRFATSPAVSWHLRRRIVVPITAEIGGTTRHFTLRGDCLLYDPTSDILPYGEAHVVAPLLFDPEWDGETASVLANFGISTELLAIKPRIIVTREGWGEIPWDWHARGFRFQPGDHLRLEVLGETDATKGRRDTYRAYGVELRVPGTTCHHRRSVGFYGSEIVPVSIPTLVALIADAYATAPSVEHDTDSHLPTPWASYGGFAKTIPHPDFSSIRIRRLGHDAEQIIPVDLAKAIAACTDATTAAEARASDIELQPGDIVELPLLKNDSEPWKGFTAGQSRYFHKALSGNIQILPKNEEPKLLHLDWQPVVWRDTTAGTLPFRPQTGFVTTRPASQDGITRMINSNEVVVERGQESPSTVSTDFVFLRDGDRLFTDRQSPSPSPRPRPAVRQARPRVIAPPPTR